MASNDGKGGTETIKPYDIIRTSRTPAYVSDLAKKMNEVIDCINQLMEKQ